MEKCKHAPDIKYYYKCSNFYTNNMYFGDESINEVICSRLFRILGIDCARYSLVQALVRINGAFYKTYVCKSVNYFAGYDSRMTLENKRAMHPDKKIGWSDRYARHSKLG